MQVARRYNLFTTLRWQGKYLLIFLIYDSIPVLLHYFLGWDWLVIPWQPISLIGIAVAFYLGFKNNSSYERLWEARKIWGGIVNTSRSFATMVINFITNLHATEKLTPDQLHSIHTRFIHRHVAWLFALTYQLRMLKSWEHNRKADHQFRVNFGTDKPTDKFPEIKPYLSETDFEHIMSKGNKASHLLNLQSRDLRDIRRLGLTDDFRHMEFQALITEMYTLQGKAERIKNFPFPRQYASANYFFIVIFVALLPFAMLSVFTEFSSSFYFWMTIPFTVLASWVFWTMEMIGDFSENPFEGLHNDVPITNMARGIEIDIRQMLDETDLPPVYEPHPESQILV